VLAVHVVGQRAADAAVRADGVHRVQFGARPDRYLADRLVGQRAGRAGRHALTAGHAGGLPHRVVQVERDPGGVALAAAPDDVVALDVVAGAYAPVAQDAGVVVHRDDRAGEVGAPPGGAGKGVLGDAEPVGQGEQFVVAGLGLLGVLLAVRLVGQQHLGEHGPAALELRGAGLDLHAVLARAHAGRGEGRGADVDHAHPADADRIVALVVTQDGNVDAGRLGGLEDRRALRGRDLPPVDRNRDGPGSIRGGDGHVRSIRLSGNSAQAEVRELGLVRTPLPVEAAHGVVAVDHGPQPLRGEPRLPA